ncbi:MAG TPA: hypothetical protein PK411_08215 [Mesotoga infera]|jgi:hypothetical protein|nr:hypothetical protein [Thermotogaceae bacterium]HNS67230.1 hypothetical protein [Mesotoga infera]HRR44457.1 hypothetical protein [Mesotoga sp.]HOI35430.1 hypothetical protein [Mesotoga infera]HPD38311.1 hypothetical protein [Mesotoga infera]
MRTRLIVVFSILLLFLTTSVFAYTLEDAQSVADRANSTVETLIASAEKTAEVLTENYKKLAETFKDSEYLLSLLEENYNRTIYILGTGLAETAFKISSAAIDKIATMGYKAVCYYVPITLGNRVFLIDPIIIIDD